MKTKFIFLSLLIVVCFSLLSYKVTYALFSNSAESSANTFTAAAVFPTSTIAPGDVVINEINWGGSNGDGNDEWIELRNTSSNLINLNNWVVENLGTGSGPGANITIASISASIPANGFFLISSFEKSGSSINVDPDYITTSISLVNGGEQLRLKNNLGTLIDTANASPGAWFVGSPSTPKKSMERKSPPSDGTVSSNWQTSTLHTNMDGTDETDEFGTPKGANSL